jgi:hypothetical protein
LGIMQILLGLRRQTTKLLGPLGALPKRREERTDPLGDGSKRVAHRVLPIGLRVQAFIIVAFLAS